MSEILKRAGLEESEQSVIRPVYSGCSGSTVEPARVSLPRVRCLDGDYTPPEKPEPGRRRAGTGTEDPPTDWVGLPTYRAGRGRIQGRVQTAKIQRQQRKMQAQINELTRQIKTQKIIVRWESMKSNRRLMRSIERVDCAAILAIVSEISGYTIAELKGHSRPVNLYHWRAVAAYVMRKNRPVSLPFIAKIIGGRDHTTILHSVRKVESNPDQFRSDIARIEALL